MFPAGTHVHVRRHDRWLSLPYWHHAVCVDDANVIEFGGGDFWNKAEVQVRQVPFVTFAGSDLVEPVSHPIQWMGLTYSDLMPPDEVIDRAKWLVENQPPPYALGYRNCESIALWCATGDFESFQVKKVMLVKSIVTVPLFALARRKPSAFKLVGAALVITSLLTSVPYLHNRALFDHTRQYPGFRSWTPAR